MDIYLIDGTYELFRHFFALPMAIDVNGQEIAATRGVLNSVLSMIEGGATHIGVATDHVVESFRNDLYPGYKTSEGVPPELLSQFPILEEALSTMGVVVWPMVEFEADDALASAAVKAADAERVSRVLICTPDKDLAQCVCGTRNDAIIGQALGSRRFEVIVRGPGGHSWSDFGQPNPIVAVSRVVSRFSQTPLPSSPKTTFNFGVISGGTSVNSIPEMAQVSIDLRSASADELQRLEDELHGVIQTEIPTRGRDGSAAKLRCELKKIGDRPVGELAENAHILEVMRAVDAHLSIPSQLRRASTDANIPIAMGREAVTVGAGGTGGGAHTLREWFDPTGRSLALKRILLAVLALAGAE